MRRSVLPALFLLLLLLAYFTRWQPLASKTYSDHTTKWVKDRWLGETWVQDYSIKRSVEVPAVAIKTFSNGEPYVHQDLAAAKKRARQIASWSWDGAFVLAVVWLGSTLGHVQSALVKREKDE